MKNLLLLFVAVAFVACSTDTDPLPQETTTNSTADRVASVFESPVNADLDEAINGKFKGVFASYDLTTKGTVVINTSDSGSLEAAVKLIKVDGNLERKVFFEGVQDLTNPNVYTFSSERGSFTVTLNDEKKLRIDHFTFDAKDSYLLAYKLTRGGDVNLAFGTFTDNDPTGDTRSGNWDAIHRGQLFVSPPGEHSTFATTLLLLDAVVITNNSNMYESTDTPADNDSFFEPCFYTTVNPFPHAWWFESASNNYREFIGYNQTSTFAGREATWNLSYYLFGGSFFYDTPACSTTAAAGFGDWAWDGRTGRIFVDTLTDI